MLTIAEKNRFNEPLDLKLSTGPRLKVWWIPQVPGKPFEVFLSSFAQAKVLLESLARYDLFQLANNIKPDFSNVGGLCVFDGDDKLDPWCDYDACDFRYQDGVPDEDFDNLTLEQCIELDTLWKPKLLADEDEVLREIDKEAEA